MKDNFTPEQKTFQELYDQNIILDEQLKVMRDEENKAKIELRDALNKINNIQLNIKILDEQFEKNCSDLQDLNK